MDGGDFLKPFLVEPGSTVDLRKDFDFSQDPRPPLVLNPSQKGTPTH